MARPLRIDQPDGFYHVTTRGVARQGIFTVATAKTRVNHISRIIGIGRSQMLGSSASPPRAFSRSDHPNQSCMMGRQARLQILGGQLFVCPEIHQRGVGAAPVGGLDSCCAGHVIPVEVSHQRTFMRPGAPPARGANRGERGPEARRPRAAGPGHARASRSLRRTVPSMRRPGSSPRR